MGQLFTLEARGLVTNPNELGTGKGSMSQADNIDIARDAVIQHPRGFERFIGTTTIGAQVKTRAMTVWNGTRIVHYDNVTTATTGILAYIDGNNYVTIMTGLEPPDGRSTITFMEAGECLYWTSNAGVYVLDALGNTPVIAGGLKALDGSTALTGTPGFMLADEQRSYRILWVIKDDKGNLIRGTPSGRIPAANAYINLDPGDIVRAGALVTVTTAPLEHGYTTGKVIDLQPGEANFAAGNKTITVLNITQFTYPEAGAAGANAVAQTVVYPSTTVNVTFTVPEGATLNHAYQIYRTYGSADGETPPDDNHYLVYEGNPTAAELTAGTITVEDVRPDSLMGDALYTNPDEDGILSANEPPPFAKDITVFKDTAFYADTISHHRLELTLLSVGGFSGYASDTLYVVVNNTTYWFSTATSLDPLHGQFNVYTYGTPAQNIEVTANSLVNAMNTLNGFPLRAYYVSNTNEIPGRIVIESESLNTDGFYVYTDFHGDVWNPPMPVIALPEDIGMGPTNNLVRTGGTTVTFYAFNNPVQFSVGDSVVIEAYDGTPADPNFPFGTKVITGVSGNTFTYTEAGPNGTTTTIAQAYVRALDDLHSTADTYVNGLYYSKPKEFQAVPLTNVFRVGDDSEGIIRTIALRDALVVFKPDGVFRVTDTADGGWVLTPLDNTLQAISPGAICIGDNQIWALTDQGLIVVNDAGGTPVSRSIENVLLGYVNTAGADKVYDRAFAVFYESDRKLYLWLPSNSDAGNDYSDFAFVYNASTDTWVRRVKRARCAVMDPSVNKMLLGYDGVMVERKSLTNKDFIDEQCAGDATLSISSVAGNGLSFVYGGTVVPEVGDIVFQPFANDPDWEAVADQDYCVVTAVDTGTSTATVDRDCGLVAGNANLLKHIECSIKWNPQHGGDPTGVKQFTEAQLFFARITVPSQYWCFSTEMSPGFTCQSVAVENPDSGWGLFPWGEAGWGEMSAEASVSRLYVPNQKQRGRMLYMKANWQAAAQYCEIQGIGIEGRAYSTSTMQSQR